MKRRLTTLLEVALMLALFGWVGWTFLDQEQKPANAINVKVQLAHAHDTAYLYRADDGVMRYRLRMSDGTTLDLTAEEFARRQYQEQSARGWLSVLFNISSPIGVLWVTVGLLGQVLFTGRMVVQWLASEKEGKSVVPPAFWWMSLTGATMLLIYFIWRKDVVGVLGQGFGWFIYVRNLWLIYFAHRANVDSPAPSKSSESRTPAPSAP